MNRLKVLFLKVRGSLWLVPVLILVFMLGASAGQQGLGIHFGGLKISKENSALPKDLNYETVEEVYDALKLNYDGNLDNQKLVEGIKHGLAQASGDQYTEYFTEQEAKDLQADLNGTFFGIGAELGKEDGNLVVISPLEGSPAADAGIRAKDIIAEIDGVTTKDLSVDAAVTKIRGDKDTKVVLTIVRGNDVQKISITRKEIVLENVKTELLENNKVGYIRIVRFSDNSAQLVTDAAKRFKEQGVTGIIVDVRGNPGGLLDASVDIASIWLKNKVVLDERRGGVTVKTYRSESNMNILGGVKTILLMDEGSASASEILAGALHDNGAATTVGVKSFGKGSVQTLDTFKDGSLLKVTIARWYTPNGKNIDKEGLQPDIEIKLSEQDIKDKKDLQKDKALELLRQQ